MAKRSHVPKFGNWDKEDNVPYTAYFDNARRGKAGVKKTINPNDPGENPEAFAHAMKRDKVMEKEDCSLFAHTPRHPRPRRTYAEKYQNNTVIDADHQQAHNNNNNSSSSKNREQRLQNINNSNNNNSSSSSSSNIIKRNDANNNNERRNRFRQPSPAADHEEHHHHRGRRHYLEKSSRTPSPVNRSPPSSSTTATTSSGISQQRKSTRSESSSSYINQSNSARSLLKRGNGGRHHGRQKSDWRNINKTTNLVSTVEDNNNSFSMSFLGMAQYFKQRSAATRPSQPADVIDHREESPPIPKFGAWDEEDPKSAEGFSEIFDRVKEEKTSPAVPSRSSGSGGSSTKPTPRAKAKAMAKPQPSPKPKSKSKMHSSDARRKPRSSSCPPKLCCLSFLRR